MCKILMQTKHHPSPTEFHVTCSRKVIHLKEVGVTVKVACFEIYYITKGKKELTFPKNLLWARLRPEFSALLPKAL